MSHPVLAHLDRSPDYVDLGASGAYLVDLRYATANNFLGKNLYGAFDRAFLHRDAAAKLERAREELAVLKPGHRFVVFDALRPRSVQRVLWAAVVGTPQEIFLANPDRGSLHNYGFAVDLSIVDQAGAELDMGAGFDEFTERAQPKFEEACLARGEVSSKQLANRHLLRDVMVHAGFAQLPHEWWHFDALSRAEVTQHFTIIE
jgi:D-alanyl-D-alanine dipeptidase